MAYRGLIRAPSSRMPRSSRSVVAVTTGTDVSFPAAYSGFNDATAGNNVPAKVIISAVTRRLMQRRLPIWMVGKVNHPLSGGSSAGRARMSGMKDEWEREVARLRLFYSGLEFIQYRTTWFGNLVPMRFHRLFPNHWIAQWRKVLSPTSPTRQDSLHQPCASRPRS